MGNYLSAPNVEKLIENGTVSGYSYAACSMQGWRLTMEDAHLAQEVDAVSSFEENSCLFGVYDGHGGSQVARFVARHLLEELVRIPEFKTGQYDNAFRSLYVNLDDLLRRDIHSAELQNLSQNSNYFPLRNQPSETSNHNYSHGTNSEVLRLKSNPAVPSRRFSNTRVLRAIKLHKRDTKKGITQALNSQNVSVVQETEVDRTDSLLGSCSLEQVDGITHKTEIRQKAQDTKSAIIPHEKEEMSSLSNTKRPPKSVSENSEERFPASSGAILPSGSATISPNNNCVRHDTFRLTSYASLLLSGVKTIFHTLTSGSVHRSAVKTPSRLALYTGCTASTVLLTKTQVVVANAGDSRAVLCRGKTALELSRDHKPCLPEEKARIYTAGGWLEFGRVNGILNLSRALGDLNFKTNHELPPQKQVISAIPDVSFIQLAPSDEFILVACDGIWEAASSQEIVDFILERIRRVDSLSDILEELFDELLSPNPNLVEVGCDNMTAILIDLKSLKSGSKV